MNVLLVTYSFPPAAGVGILRAFSLARYLPENGIQVEVLTTRNAAAVGQDHSLLAQLPSSVAVHRTWTLDLPFALRKAIKRLVSRRASTTRPATTSSPSATGANPGLLKRLLGNLLLPDPQVGWLPFALPAAKRLIREKKIDAVLITVPPFSTVLLASRLRWIYPDLPIILDFRDEWLSTTINLVSFNNNQRARAIAQQAESNAVRDASLVVCVTHAAVNELQRRYPDLPAEKFQCIPNGYDTPAHAPALPVQGTGEDPGRPTVLTYIGTVYGSTDPTAVVDAILQLPAEFARRLRLRFIGHIESQRYRETLERLGDRLELVGFLPQKDALQYVRDTDYLLLITHDPINVAAKLYDYLGSGRPVLAAVHPTGDVRRILDQTNAGWSADINDPAALRLLLEEAIARTPHLAEAFQPEPSVIAGYHRKPLAAGYASLLAGVVARSGRG